MVTKITVQEYGHEDYCSGVVTIIVQGLNTKIIVQEYGNKDYCSGVFFIWDWETKEPGPIDSKHCPNLIRS
jgi:hypothetical protein